VQIDLDQDVAEKMHRAFEAPKITFDMFHEAVHTANEVAVIVCRIRVIAVSNQPILSAIDTSAIAVQDSPYRIFRDIICKLLFIDCVGFTQH